MPAAKAERLTRAIEPLKEKLTGLAALAARMQTSGEQQISLTEVDAREMASEP